MNNPSRRCDTCEAYHVPEGQPNPECRRNPPTVSIVLMPQAPTLAGRGPGFAPATLSAYAPTRPFEWCLQWSPRLQLVSH